MNQSTANLSDIIIAITSAIYTITTIFLWLTTRSSIRLTKKLFEFVNNPFIGVESLKLYSHSNIPGSGTIKLIIKNFGNTIGTNIKIGTKFELNDKLLPIDIKLEPIILPPNHTSEFSFDILKDDFEQISRRLPFVALIEIFYDTIENKNKTTRWCYKFIGGNNFVIYKADVK